MDKVSKIISCFNPKRNYEEIFGISKLKNNNYDVFNGIRVIFTFWTMIGHILIDHLKSMGANASVFYDRMKYERSFTIITNATVLADVFLMISGFLAIQTCLKIFKEPESRNVWNIFKVYIGRYFRIMTLLAILLLVFIYGTEKSVTCQANVWWMNFLLINNFISMWAQCLNITWYLCCDFQFFLIIPFIAIMLHKYPRKYTIVLLSTVALASVILQMYLAYKHDMHLWAFDFAMLERQYDQWYITPYCRILPYLMGIGLYLLLDSKSSINNLIDDDNSNNNNKLVKYIFYLIGSVLVFLVFWLYPEFYMHKKLPLIFGALYNTFHKPLFVLGIILILYPSLRGKSKVIKSFLASAPFTWLGKISYGIFLFHPLLSGVYVPFMGPKELDFLMIIKDSLSIFVASTIISFILTVFVETPVMKIVKLALNEKTNKKIE